MAVQADKVSHASLNGIYVKAQELDRGHNEYDAPAALPPGFSADEGSHASTHASDGVVDAESHASAREPDHAAFDAETHASDW